uniref:Uncharacterized protein n=1 Tax=Rhizophora mucronata TaxID=61149 RepID=A0A2P2QZ76_RHIMU
MIWLLVHFDKDVSKPIGPTDNV